MINLINMPGFFIKMTNRGIYNVRQAPSGRFGQMGRFCRHSNSHWIGGILSCISIVGIIPGIVAIILGLKLRSVKSYADQVAADPDDASQASRINLMINDLSSYFKIQGILMIIGLVLAVIGIIAILSSAFFSYLVNETLYY